jgi:hypothetical protein
MSFYAAGDVYRRVQGAIDALRRTGGAGAREAVSQQSRLAAHHPEHGCIGDDCTACAQAWPCDAVLQLTGA